MALIGELLSARVVALKATQPGANFLTTLNLAVWLEALVSPARGWGRHIVHVIREERAIASVKLGLPVWLSRHTTHSSPQSFLYSAGICQPTIPVV